MRATDQTIRHAHGMHAALTKQGGDFREHGPIGARIARVDEPTAQRRVGVRLRLDADRNLGRATAVRTVEGDRADGIPARAIRASIVITLNRFTPARY